MFQTRDLAAKMKELKRKFCSKFEVSDSGCWFWQGTKNSCGYGYFYLGKGHVGGGKGTGAHRASYYLFKGPIPEGKFVLHTCDNRNCVNPAHLFLGTQLDNMRDCVEKRRNCRGERMSRFVKGKAVSGENHYKTRLKSSDIDKIMLLRNTGLTYKQIATFVPAAPSAICQIYNGKRWSSTTGLGS